MAEQPQKASLEEVLGYKLPEYYSDADKKFIRDTFSKPEALNILRKIFLPTFSDSALPFEQMGKDFFMSGRNWENIPMDEAKVLMVARSEVAKYILGGILEIKQICMQPEESDQDKTARIEKNSTK